ncbi:ERG2 family protein [Bradyrhizobium sp. BR 1432]|uniref:ERG2 family protein n=1 Tax=Bradyrhizobium sp. BR 1432 TaxID=3447966 RepID=UPI003EE5D65A
MAYVFDPDVLRAAARAGSGLPLEERLRTVTRELAKCYPGRISEEQEWVFSNAGGVMGQFSILYASLTEYVIFFGSPIGSSGHTGRYSFVKDWAFLLDGELWYFEQGQLSRDVVRAGDEVVLEFRRAKGYRIVDHAWILEYARGPIVTMLPFGLADAFFSTLDGRTICRTFRLYGKHVLRNWRTAAGRRAQGTSARPGARLK